MPRTENRSSSSTSPSTASLPLSAAPAREAARPTMSRSATTPCAALSRWRSATPTGRFCPSTGIYSGYEWISPLTDCTSRSTTATPTSHTSTCWTTSRAESGRASHVATPSFPSAPSSFHSTTGCSHDRESRSYGFTTFHRLLFRTMRLSTESERYTEHGSDQGERRHSGPEWSSRDRSRTRPRPR